MIFIKGNFPSFKNSKQFTGKYFIMSKTVQRYLKEWEYQWVEFKDEFLKEKDGTDEPIMVGMHFVRGTKHKYDWVNMVQGVQDLMVKHGWISDDNTEIMFPSTLSLNGKYTSYDRENPGVYIKIIK